MRPLEKWIWLPESAYPKHQITRYWCQSAARPANYCVARFARTYIPGKPVAAVSLRVSGDTVYRLFLDGHIVLAGPASAGGDFFDRDVQRPNHYAECLTLTDAECAALRNGVLDFAAEVRMKPVRMFEYSMGHGGFMLTANVTFTDGTEEVYVTDETWSAVRLTAYDAEGHFDASLPADAPVPAQVIENIWHAEDSPLPPLEAETVIPQGGEKLTVPAGGRVEFELPTEKIYTCCPVITADVPDGTLNVEADYYETQPGGTRESYVFAGQNTYRGFDLHSVGCVKLTAENSGKADAHLSVSLVNCHYPTPVRAVTTTSDASLDLVTEVCAHTLKQCRQTLHLDSPRHCEPLACTGDYYIETLMTAFTFGDLSLAAFDVRRTAELLRHHDGRMFHTTYSLIWVQMLWDTYMLTGETALLAECRDALTMLLARFETYIGENGLIETPPDYMFIDWLNPDGISTHHPPKALGQTCLCLFYFGALKTAAKVYDTLGAADMAKKQLDDADKMRSAVLAQLYDAERHLFFEGLNTPTPVDLLGEFMPPNVNKRYYRRHANILAAYFGILPQSECRALLTRIFEDDSLGEVQPYFMHYWLEAIDRNGLRDEQTLKLLELWKAPVAECPKGLTEGFYKPEPTYSFDHSHAWGGTPAYALPKALSGIELLEPGYARIRLNPSLLGLERAHVEIPTPHGFILIDMERGKEPEIDIPDGITLENASEYV